MMRSACTLALALFAVSAGRAENSPATEAVVQPIRIVAQHLPSGLSLQLIGKVDAPEQLAYDLKLQGGSVLNQKGTARLIPGAEKILLNATVNGIGPWRAILNVTRGSGASFTVERSFAGSGS